MSEKYKKYGLAAKRGILTSGPKPQNVFNEIQLDKLYGYWLHVLNVNETVSVILTDPSCRKQQQSRLPLFPGQRGAVWRDVQMQQKALHPAIKVDLMQSRENSVRVHPFSSMSLSLSLSGEQNVLTPNNRGR